jgi:hydrogenase maturation protease
MDVVLGVGNALLGDEGVGVRAAELLEGRVPDGTSVVAAGALGPATIVEIEGARHLLVLDAMECGLAPGSIVRCAGADLPPAGTHLSVHGFGVADLLVLLAQRGAVPEETVVLGVQPATLSPRTSLTPEVEAVLPELVDAALAVLEEWR